MANAILVDTPGLTQQHYEAVTADLGLNDGLPDGCTVHIAGPMPDGAGWRVITVWDDMDKAQAFLTEKLRPAQERAGAPAPAGPPQMWQVHRLVHA
ncbi:MAG: hypothetical protein M3N21_04675 [Actinomycetota bacterium]|nr:hypothetical protein [Actinomycetota bacterium]